MSALAVPMFTKRLRHYRCGKRLGAYQASFWKGYVELHPIRLPHPMVEWDGLGSKPELFFLTERPNVNRTGRVWLAGSENVIPRYRWGCGCGAEIVLAVGGENVLAVIVGRSRARGEDSGGTDEPSIFGNALTHEAERPLSRGVFRPSARTPPGETFRSGRWLLTGSARERPSRAATGGGS